MASKDGQQQGAASGHDFEVKGDGYSRVNTIPVGTVATPATATTLSWPTGPRRLRSALHIPSELVLNFISLLIVTLLALYIVFLLVYDGALIELVPAPSSFLREISQLVSPKIGSNAP